MAVSAVLYTSNTGFTKEYAEILSEKISLPVYPLGKEKIPRKSEIIYLGWVAAGSVKGYDKAYSRYTVKAVCGVCMGFTGSQTEDIRKKDRIPEDIPVFTVQGGFDPSKLHGYYKFVMKPVLKKMVLQLESIENKTPEEELALEMVTVGKNLVDEKNLAQLTEWYSGQ
jgi:hypothetical protein